LNIEKRKMKKHTLASMLLALAVISGCAMYKAVPEGFAGATAVIADSVETEDGAKARVYFVEEVDGNKIHNVRIASRLASQGRGFSLSTGYVDRPVPVRMMRLKLVGTHVVAAPIHELASRAAGTFFDVDGFVEFTPKANARYVVRGELKKDASSVWIEDAETKDVVTTRIRVK
jgi:hypothetical protein